jgi:hypothetical protein
MVKEEKGKHITASEHIKMNSKLVRRKYTQFRLLNQEHHKINHVPLTIQFKKKENVNGIKMMGNTCNEKKQN